jgi:hypothetical protein
LDKKKIENGSTKKLEKRKKPPPTSEKEGLELRGIRMFALRSSKSPMVHAALDNNFFSELGLVSLESVYNDLYL